jgi:predicted ABC-type transport system involved in lysophospholipase L1 biosynthesis ATPase subunit
MEKKLRILEEEKSAIRLLERIIELKTENQRLTQELQTNQNLYLPIRKQSNKKIKKNKKAINKLEQIRRDHRLRIFFYSLENPDNNKN